MTSATLVLLVLAAAAYGIQTAAGFGAGLVLITLGVNFIELPTLLALALPLSVFQTAWVTTRYWRDVDARVLLRKVLPVMGTGVALGYVVAARVGQSAVVKQLLGVFIIALASRELWRLHRRAQPVQGGRWVSAAAIFSAGLVHGVYATGGPLLVYGLGREDLDRARFRATITTVWLVLNVILVATFAMEGRYTREVLTQLGLMLVGIPFGIVAGERVFARLDERTFRWGVYGLLLLAGVPLLAG